MASSPCKLVFGRLSETKFKKKECCLVIATNCVTCRNYGIAQDIVRVYPYADVAGLRYNRAGTSYAAFRHRGIEGTAVLRVPEGENTLDAEEPDLPVIATLLTQYGIGASVEENEFAKTSIMYSKDEDHAERLRNDTREMRYNHFYASLKSLKSQLMKVSREDVKYILFAAGIGLSGRVNCDWLNHYLPAIVSFGEEMKRHGKVTCIAITEIVLSHLEERCADDVKLKDASSKLKRLEIMDVEKLCLGVEQNMDVSSKLKRLEIVNAEKLNFGVQRGKLCDTPM